MLTIAKTAICKFCCLTLLTKFYDEQMMDTILKT